MKFNLCVAGALLVVGIHFASSALSQSPEPAAPSFVDGTDLRKEMTEREGNILKLSTEDQLRLRAAQLKAAEYPEVKVALEKRTKALEEFGQAFRAGLLKADPKIGEILDKIAVGANPGY